MRIGIACIFGGIGLSLTRPVAAFAQVVQPFLPLPLMPPAQPQSPTVMVEPPRGTTVLSRPRPETDAQGVRLGSFFLYPRAQLDESYNDNIFATSGSTTGDLITTLAPSFDLLSNWGADALNLHAGADLGFYASHSSENYRDAFASSNGRIDLDQGRSVHGGVQISRLHESRYSPDSPGAAAAPVKYMTYGGNAGYAQGGLRIGYSADFSVNRSEYEAAPRIGGGFIPQSDRNVTIPDLALRGSYSFTEGIGAYLRGEANIRSFDHAAGNGTPIRDSAGYRVDVGLHADLTGVTVADLYVGYLEQDYRSSVYSTLRGVDLGAAVTWNPTTLDTVLFSVNRTVQDLNNAVLAPGRLSPGYLDTHLSLSEDHELLRNLLLNANASFENDAFQNIDRGDNVYGVGVGAKYLMNRFFYVGVSYAYAHRESSGAQAIAPFSDNILMLRLSSQL